MESQEKTTRRIHRNIPQLLFQIIQANVSVCIWGRATGKTEGPMVDFTLNNIFAMPRSNGFLLGTTYTQLLDRTIPPLIAGWEKYGYFENKHYWIRKYAPSKFRLPKAYRHPIEPTHYIHWYNGTGLYLVSQDRPGTINGVRTQFGAGDEARLLNKAKMDEDLIPTMAGHADLFGHMSNYLSLLFCSDMPRHSKGKWLLDYVGLMDKEVIKAILQVHGEIVRLKTKYQEAALSTQQKLKPRLHRLYEFINELRKDTVYFSTASTLDNVHALGIEPIKKFRQTLTDLDFRISILNKEIFKLENGFYSLLDEDIHGYDNFDYQYIESLEWDYRKPGMQDCRWDGDVDKDQALDIACDHNNAINGIITGQEIGNEYRFLSSKYVLGPSLLPDMVELWHNYYKYHPIRDVNYYHDSTSISGGRSATSNINFAEEMKMELSERGWNVNVIDVGQIGSHHSRHFLWAKMLQGNDKRMPIFRYNKSNSKDWMISAQQAGIRKVGEETKKDKRPEQDPNIPPQEATHLSEAGDILIWGRIRPLVEDDSPFVPVLTSN